MKVERGSYANNWVKYYLIYELKYYTIIHKRGQLLYDTQKIKYSKESLIVLKKNIFLAFQRLFNITIALKNHDPSL